MKSADVKRDASASETRNAFFLILFSSNLDDEVFLANEAQRQEYILNQEGVIYLGTENAVLAQPWDFSQVRGPICLLSYSHQQRKGAYLLCVQDATHFHAVALMKEPALCTHCLCRSLCRRTGTCV